MIAKYSTVVYPRNRHSGYGKPVIVYAENQQDAVNKAIEIGWGGYPRDARVLVKSVEAVLPSGEGERDG